MDTICEDEDPHLAVLSNATPESVRIQAEEYDTLVRKNRRIMYLRRLFYLYDVSRGVKRDEPKLPGWWTDMPDNEGVLDFAVKRATIDWKDYCDFQTASTRLQHKAQTRREREIPNARRKKTPPCDDVSILDNYFVGELLSKGSVGKVHLGICEGNSDDPSNFVAIKTVNKSNIKDKKNIERIREEISIARMMDHRNVIRLFSATEFPKHVLFCMEYAHGGDLLSYVKQKGRLVLPESRNIFSQIHQALLYLHDTNICHRDVKPENVLLTEERGSNGRPVVKLADFGVAAYTQSPDGTDRLFDQYCGTLSYMAPEVVLRQIYTGKPVDCWSLGVLLYTIIYGTQPFKDTSEDALVEKISSAAYSLPNFVYDASTDIIRDLLVVLPIDRPTIRQVGEYEWMNDKSNPTWLRARGGTGGGAKARLQYNIARSSSAQVAHGERSVDHYRLEKHDTVELLFPSEEPERWFDTRNVTPPPRQQDKSVFPQHAASLWPRSAFNWAHKHPHVAPPPNASISAPSMCNSNQPRSTTPIRKDALHVPPAYPFVHNVNAAPMQVIGSQRGNASSSGHGAMANASTSVTNPSSSSGQQCVPVIVVPQSQQAQQGQPQSANAFPRQQAPLSSRPQFSRLNVAPLTNSYINYFPNNSQGMK